jgi:hypothetical protein
MIIGTVRPEEARVHDTHAGYHQFHTDPQHAGDLDSREAYGSFEIFWDDGDVSAYGGEPRNYDGDGLPIAPGWYWCAASPGCLWDGEPSGPFATSRQALQDADEWHPEFDGE